MPSGRFSRPRRVPASTSRRSSGVADGSITSCQTGETISDCYAVQGPIHPQLGIAMDVRPGAGNAVRVVVDGVELRLDRCELLEQQRTEASQINAPDLLPGAASVGMAIESVLTVDYARELWRLRGGLRADFLGLVVTLVHSYPINLVSACAV